MHLLSFSLLGALALSSVAEANDRTTYSYDSKGRLRAVSHVGGPSGGATVTFEYDDAGNRYLVTSTAASGGGGCGFNVLDASGNSEFSFDIPIQRVGVCSGPVVIRYQRNGESGTVTFNPQDEYQYVVNRGGGCGGYSYVITISVESGNAHVERGAANINVVDNC